MSPSVPAPVSVRGHASVEEVAAVLAALTTRRAPASEGAYDRWRRVRLAALRPTVTRGRIEQ